MFLLFFFPMWHCGHSKTLLWFYFNNWAPISDQRGQLFAGSSFSNITICCFLVIICCDLGWSLVKTCPKTAFAHICRRTDLCSSSSKWGLTLRFLWGGRQPQSEQLLPWSPGWSRPEARPPLRHQLRPHNHPVRNTATGGMFTRYKQWP